MGESGTHSLLTGHSALINAKLFTDLEELNKGDIFFLHILDEVLAYEVDQIKIIEPSDLNYLRPIEEGEYTTLITCTPYGINSHRLLVRGTRIDYTPEIEENAINQKEYKWTEQQISVMRVAILTALIMLLLIIIVYIKRKADEYEEKKQNR